MNRYELYKDRNNQWRWRYVSANGRTIADSGEAYWNRQDAINGINLMRSSALSPTYG